MKRSMLLAMTIALTSLVGIAATAAGQTSLTPPPNQWDHGTKLSVFSGAAIASPDTRGTFGTAIGWEINHRVELEGTGSWFPARQGNDAFAAELKVSGNLTGPRAVVPFVAAGVGLYHASFDTTRAVLPDFYQRRLLGSSIGAIANFTDPSLVFAGGANFFVGPHFSIRPDMSVRLVTRSSDTFAVTMATVYLSYHFEEHIAAGNRTHR
jgi:hypothetical protein